MLRNMRRFIKTDYESAWAREINLIRRNICALIKEVNQQKDMVLISVETCLLCRVEFVAWVFCIYYACQSDAQPDTRVLLFCHREPNTHTHTRICAPIMQIFESDKWTENQLQICISVNCGTISAPHALQILKKETQKHYALSQWNLKNSLSFAFCSKIILR